MTAEIPQRPRTLGDLAAVLREHPLVIDARAHADVHEYVEAEFRCEGVPSEVSQEIGTAGFWLCETGTFEFADGTSTLAIIRDQEGER